MPSFPFWVALSPCVESSSKPATSPNIPCADISLGHGLSREIAAMLYGGIA